MYIKPITKRSSAFYLMELGLFTPMVISQRLWGMSAAGLSPSAKDKREYDRMWSEKVSAFSQSGMAFSTGLLVYQQKVWRAFSSVWFASSGAQANALQRFWKTGSIAQENLLRASLSPIRNTAVANARRLGRSK